VSTDCESCDYVLCRYDVPAYEINEFIESLGYKNDTDGYIIEPEENDRLLSAVND
jgi:hypothetical protein